MRFLRSIGTLVLVLLMAAGGALFALQNDSQVPLDVLVYQFAPRSLALWVLVAFALGGVLGLFMSSVVVMGLRARMRLLGRQLTKAQRESERLRSRGIVARD